LTKASTKGAVIITTAAANSKPCTTGANVTRAARSRSPAACWSAWETSCAATATAVIERPLWFSGDRRTTFATGS
jgi:hypothetical protein